VTTRPGPPGFPVIPESTQRLPNSDPFTQSQRGSWQQEPRKHSEQVELRAYLNSSVYPPSSDPDRRRSGPADAPWWTTTRNTAEVPVAQDVHHRVLPPSQPVTQTYTVPRNDNPDLRVETTGPPFMVAWGQMDYAYRQPRSQSASQGPQQPTPPTSSNGVSPTEVTEEEPVLPPLECHLANFAINRDGSQACTNKDHRKVTSHFFGRNKGCTKRIPREAWLMACRCCYQRAVYHGNKHDNLHELQRKFLDDQLDKINDSAISINWEIRWVNQLNTRLAKYRKISEQNDRLRDDVRLSSAQLVEKVLDTEEMSEKKTGDKKLSSAQKELAIATCFPNITGRKTFDEVKRIVSDVYHVICRSPDTTEFPRFEMLPHDLVPKRAPGQRAKTRERRSLAVLAARERGRERRPHGRAAAQHGTRRHASPSQVGTQLLRRLI
jgi:hypothetical protein